ncbi:unknown similar to AMEV116 [Mythimna separata entomopoxvirus 'L']|uniref:Uncharacterized protein n=1 Tax=Mythimna separata entomopoxvirus 'L' TaxID=1293572 RepID=A0A916KQI0_9POXV|nr:unknown similar to AMEV116 [Mythimna separata entomopoxvirus 'L']CCU56331.1 unknown similar to AMEV116 [Mythimna separata entomopoxvirus 'L']
MLNKIKEIIKKYDLNINENFLINTMKYSDNIKFCILIDNYTTYNILVKNKMKLDDTLVLCINMNYCNKTIAEYFNRDIIKLLNDNIYVYFTYNVNLSIYSIIRDNTKEYIKCDIRKVKNSIDLYNDIVELKYKTLIDN